MGAAAAPAWRAHAGQLPPVRGCPAPQLPTPPYQPHPRTLTEPLGFHCYRPFAPSVLLFARSCSLPEPPVARPILRHELLCPPDIVPLSVLRTNLRIAAVPPPVTALRQGDKAGEGAACWARRRAMAACRRLAANARSHSGRRRSRQGGYSIGVAAMSGVLAEFLALSPASQAVVLLVIGTAAWIVIRLTLRVLRLLLALLPAHKPPVAAPEPRQAAKGCAAGWYQPAS